MKTTWLFVSFALAMCLKGGLSQDPQNPSDPQAPSDPQVPSDPQDPSADPQAQADPPAQLTLEQLVQALEQAQRGKSTGRGKGRGLSRGPGRGRGRGRGSGRGSAVSQGASPAGKGLAKALRKALERRNENAERNVDSLVALANLVNNLPGTTEEQRQDLIVSLARETLLSACNAVVSLPSVVAQGSLRSANFVAACNEIFEILIAPPTTASPDTTQSA